MEKIQSRVFLKEISGSIALEKTSSDWWPFEGAPVAKNLRVVADNIGSSIARTVGFHSYSLADIITDIRQLILELNGDIGGLKASVPFRLTAAISAQETSFEVAILPESDRTVTMGQLLDMTGLLSIFDVQEKFPSVSNLSNALSIYTASVGWTGRTLQHLYLGVEVGDWKITDKFIIRELSLDISARNLSGSRDSKQFALFGSGIIQISEVDVAIVFDMVRRGSKTTATFRIATEDYPLSLGATLRSFFGDGHILPGGFEDLLDQTEIESISVQGLYKPVDGWCLSNFELKMAISAELKIFGMSVVAISPAYKY